MGSRYALSRKSVDRRLNVWRGVTVLLVMGNTWKTKGRQTKPSSEPTKA